MVMNEFWKGVGKAFINFCTTVLALLSTGLFQQ